jgi:hypothetical protein
VGEAAALLFGEWYLHRQKWLLVLEEFQTARRLPHLGTQPSLHTEVVLATSQGQVEVEAGEEAVLEVVVAHQMEKLQVVLGARFLRR